MDLLRFGICTGISCGVNRHVERPCGRQVLACRGPNTNSTWTRLDRLGIRREKKRKRGIKSRVLVVREKLQVKLEKR